MIAGNVPADALAAARDKQVGREGAVKILREMPKAARGLPRCEAGLASAIARRSITPHFGCEGRPAERSLP